MQQFDIAIIGGGLVGASFTRAIAASGLKTVVIDQQPADSLYSPTLDNRGIALSYSSMQILSGLQVWHLLEAEAHTIKTVHVSEQGRFGIAKLNASKDGYPSLGCVVSASSLGAALMHGLDELPGVTVLRPATISSVAYDPECSIWTLNLENFELKAKLLVAADGTNSFLRDSLNIAAIFRDTKQSAIVANVTTQILQHETAYERFTPDGVLALLPFGAQQLKCVWTVEDKLVDELKTLSDTCFLDRIQAIFGLRLGRFNSVTARQIFPIQVMQAASLYSERAVLLGNAANTLHPVAAQGFNLGLRDAATLAKVLLAGDYNLQEYALLRAKDHQCTQEYTNTLVDLFASDRAIIKLSRNLGLLATQFIPALNRHITARGMGIWTS